MAERFEIALLSNINADSVKRKVESRGLMVWTPPGYGNVFGPLLDPSSGLCESGAKRVFILVDLSELLVGCKGKDDVRGAVEAWFDGLRACRLPGMEVFVSSGLCRRPPYCGDWKTNPVLEAERMWDAALESYISESASAFRLEVADAANRLGRQEFFSDQLWYLARIPYTAAASEELASLIACRVAGGKKVLVCDLDDTLWGGVVGELGPQGIELSDEHKGLIYKDVQREVARMARAGVVVCVASKNNPEDALAPFRENPHMQLGEEDITSFKLGWGRKDESLRELAAELNVGLDSMVFLDDNPTERELVGTMLPEVEVVDFPSDVSELPSVLRGVFERLFMRPALTEEDRAKSEQYRAMARRSELERAAGSFDEYLEGLGLRARRVDPAEHVERLAQLVGKTNQFNLTTVRRSLPEMEQIVRSPEEWLVLAYDVADAFGDNGITALALVDLRGGRASLDTLILSCRVMGKQIEDFLVGRVEDEVESRGLPALFAEYRPTQKNAPVARLYDRLGYERVREGADGAVEYRIELGSRPARKHHVKEID